MLEEKRKKKQQIEFFALGKSNLLPGVGYLKPFLFI